MVPISHINFMIPFMIPFHFTVSPSPPSTVVERCASSSLSHNRIIRWTVTG